MRERLPFRTRPRRRPSVDHLERDLGVLRPVREQPPPGHDRLAAFVELADDQHALLRGEVVPLLVGLRDDYLEPLCDRLSPLAGCEPSAHEAASFTMRPDATLCSASAGIGLALGI